MPSVEPAQPPENETHSFLLRTAELLHQHGTPSFRLEDVMGKLARSLSVRSVFLYTPTALVIALGSGENEKTYLRRVDPGNVDISKVLAFDAILEDVESGLITINAAAGRLEAAANATPPFNRPISVSAAAVACAGVAVLFGGNLADAILAGGFGCLIAFVTTLQQRSASQQGWLDPVLGFATAITAVVIAQWLPVDYRLVTLAALILPIPGFTLTIALTELATGHLSSGSARLAGAMVTLFTLVVGVAIAWRLCAGWIQPAQLVMDDLPWWCLWIAVAVTPLALAIVFKAPMSQWPTIMLVVVSGFLTCRFVGSVAGTEVGAFAGALIVGCGSNIYARLLNRPAMVPQTPGLMILVPGSVGYQSLTAMVENDTIRGVELAVSMSLIGVALVAGLLLASQVISPKRML